MPRKWMWIAGGVGALVLGILFWPRPYCRTAHEAYGIKVRQCPDGLVRQTLHIRGNKLYRGGRGEVSMWATALYTIKRADSALRTRVPELEARLALVDQSGKERRLEPQPPDPHKPREKKWRRYGSVLATSVTLPKDIADGDYKLRAYITTKIGKGHVDLPLALYAPARIHVLTDRPLYEPGHRIQFRALVVRARDLTPIDSRPGRWLVKDPNGVVVLEEKAAAGEWGVASGNFLLDKKAPSGTWTITWKSGADTSSATVRVEPFKLPRFRVSATPDKTFYRGGETPKVQGSVIYSSGAPVQGAKVSLSWRVIGAWPPPASWLAPGEQGLPRSASTDAAGRFALTLPQVPQDLQGRVQLVASLAAVDPAGDRVHGALALQLSQDAIQVAAMTPLAKGLVGGFNNRLYLRVTGADGRALAGARITVRKAWLAASEGIKTELDEDSVARVQIDPGAPVNVVIPARPRRRSASAPGQVRRTRAHDYVANQQASLDDQVEMDRWLALVKPCAKWAESDGDEAHIALTVSPAGAITAGSAGSELARCALARIKGRKLPAGSARLYALTLAFPDPKLPSLSLDVDTVFGSAPSKLQGKLAEAARGARDCLPRKLEGLFSTVLSWRIQDKQRKPTLTWMQGKSGRAMPAAVQKCIRARAAAVSLDYPATATAIGIVRYTISQPDSDGPAAPKPTIMRGYELRVAAFDKQGKAIGETKLRMRPGRIPPLSVRVKPVLAQPGEKVTVRLLRGPDYSGVLPRAITVAHLGRGKLIKLPKKQKKRVWTYELPKNAKGWYTFNASGQRALVFVRRGGRLSVKVSAEKARYAPGADAKLDIRTQLSGRGVKAGVGLVGVDETLSQLVALPGPEALRALRVKIKMQQKAFGVLDAQALALGRVRGRYAAEATVLRVAEVPSPAALDVVLNGTAATKFDPNVALTDRFYIVLAELHRQVRAWEKSAPAKELMTPKTMATMWTRALASAEKKGKKVVDAFGRKLRLHRLPSDLFALTDPRQVVAVGTRLPEDVENWSQWVRRHRP
ncbi:MAG: hypothetical protein KC503_17770 [Myxococcales bacterium]|nr:hypothetical protein [Myxococcales bacterium]